MKVFLILNMVLNVSSNSKGIFYIMADLTILFLL